MPGVPGDGVLLPLAPAAASSLDVSRITTSCLSKEALRVGCIVLFSHYRGIEPTRYLCSCVPDIQRLNPESCGFGMIQYVFEEGLSGWALVEF